MNRFGGSMSSTTLSTMLLAFAAVAAAACSAAPGDSNEADLASSQQALVRGDCAPYNGFTGALGAATIDCLGRVGTFDYAVQTSPQGFFGLTRRFDSCPNLSGNDAELKLLQIDQLLSIQAPERQYREQRAKFPKELANLPDAIACVANAFATAQKRLL